jgi:hypothetical protein
MKKSIAMLKRGFESSSGLTPEFAQFFRTFKSEFTKELQTIGASNIVFSRGHFYVSGFFTDVSGQAWYFSLSDVRGMDYTLRNNPDSCMAKLLYRTAKNYKDFTGGHNRYRTIEPGMAKEMCWSFKLID